MIGIIGGSGLSSVEEIEVLNKKTINTPYGKPSAELIVGVVDKKIITMVAAADEREPVPRVVFVVRSKKPCRLTQSIDWSRDRHSPTPY